MIRRGRRGSGLSRRTPSSLVMPGQHGVRRPPFRVVAGGRLVVFSSPWRLACIKRPGSGSLAEFDNGRRARKGKNHHCDGVIGTERAGVKNLAEKRNPQSRFSTRSPGGGARTPAPTHDTPRPRPAGYHFCIAPPRCATASVNAYRPRLLAPRRRRPFAWVFTAGATPGCRKPRRTPASWREL